MSSDEMKLGVDLIFALFSTVMLTAALFRKGWTGGYNGGAVVGPLIAFSFVLCAGIPIGLYFLLGVWAGAVGVALCATLSVVLYVKARRSTVAK